MLTSNAKASPIPSTELLQTLINFSKHGNGIARIYLGLKPYVLLSKCRSVEGLLTSNVLIEKGRLYDFMRPWLGISLLTSTGKTWKSRRRLLTPSFHFKILEDFVEVFNHQALRLVDKLQSRVGDAPFNVCPLVELCSLDIIMETAMGVDINAQNDEECNYLKAVHGMSDLIMKRHFAPWLHSDIGLKLSRLGKKHSELLSALHAMSLGAIKTRRTAYNKLKAEKDSNKDIQTDGGKKRLVFLDILLETSEQPDRPLSDENIRAEVDTFIFAGHESVATTINFALFLLGCHPQIQTRVVQELHEVLGEGDVTITSAALRGMTFLEACIKEALRLFPPFPFLSRRLHQPAVTDGYQLPEGTDIIIMVYCIHRDPEQFPDPDNFNPDRFLGAEAAKRHPFSFIPFSAGPRNCIGKKFGMMEMKVVLAHLLRTFEVTCRQTVDELGLRKELTLRPEHGVMITLQRRG
ncbi:Cytochrome P450 CYP4V33 [Hyalella azteca]|uniref:Cytochrome P450 CYP4V33 n=1 Tax=Hyalella azteca TaxID=294128 RepID=A0A6A0GRG4_HYAAZ|nr:Cytochrome P450 CYP4V33 [Hyalella azteca]